MSLIVVQSSNPIEVDAMKLFMLFVVVRGVVALWFDGVAFLQLLRVVPSVWRESRKP